jgi:hypothetical protein
MGVFSQHQQNIDDLVAEIRGTKG